MFSLPPSVCLLIYDPGAIGGRHRKSHGWPVPLPGLHSQIDRLISPPLCEEGSQHLHKGIRKSRFKNTAGNGWEGNLKAEVGTLPRLLIPWFQLKVHKALVSLVLYFTPPSVPYTSIYQVLVSPGANRFISRSSEWAHLRRYAPVWLK